MGVNPRDSLRRAAAVLLCRGSEVWLGQRGDTRFLPGFWVFPGGGDDPGEQPEAAARRELQEETGLLLESPFLPFARAITPEYSPVRYDCRVFRTEVPEGAEPVADGNELARGRWFEVEEAIALRDRGEIQMAPPTYRQLELYQSALEGQRPFPDESEAFADPPLSRQEVLPMADGVTVVPLRSPALPPAAWTNAVIVGIQSLYVIDPGGADPGTLTAELDRMVGAGAQIAGVILTHHHGDHLAGYSAMNLRHLPLLCHPSTAALLPPELEVGATVDWNDGEILAVDPGLDMVAHWTPGHAPGHLAIEIPQRSTLLAADLISSLSSIVIPLSNGDLPRYLESLRRMRALDCRLIIPSHGPPYGQGSDPFGVALTHRQTREDQIIRVMEHLDRPSSLESLTATIYGGLDERLLPSAQANVWHHLRKLAIDGVVAETDRGWRKL